MAIVRLGMRRLYDALGFENKALTAISEKVDLSIGKSIAVYLGPSPPIGIMSLEGSQYGIPGRQSVMFNLKNEYESNCFLEIAVTFPHEITPQELDLLKANDKKTNETLLQKARAHPDLFEKLLDAVSGALGLRFHRQLVLKLLVEHVFLMSDSKPLSSFTGPAVEMLESLQINSNTGTYLRGFLQALEKTPEEIFAKAGTVLHWLLKAWRERDPISKFMYLFIPLEAILQSDQEADKDALRNLDSLTELVKRSDIADREALLRFLDMTRNKFGPTLNSRFEEFARKMAIPGWELDVKAFKRYNRMRNLLLHAGNKHVREHINFEENTRTLEDLVERYVSVALLGTADVYKTRWRPECPPAVKRD